MKKSIALGVAATALMMANAAHAQSGYVGLSYLNTDGGGSSDLDTTALSGGLLLGDNVQINAHYANLDASSSGDYWGIEGHLFMRNDRHMIGGFVSYDTIDIGSYVDEWAIGFGGQLYTGNTTWSGSLGYADTDDAVQNTSLDLEARHFVSDNFSFQGNIGGGSLEFPGSDDDYTSYGLGAEVQLSGAPVSFHGGWQRIDSSGTEIDALGIGARWNFGGGTLIERNRSGASLQRRNPTYLELLFGSGGPTPR